MGENRDFGENEENLGKSKKRIGDSYSQSGLYMRRQL